MKSKQIFFTHNIRRLAITVLLRFTRFRHLISDIKNKRPKKNPPHTDDIHHRTQTINQDKERSEFTNTASMKSRSRKKNKKAPSPQLYSFPPIGKTKQKCLYYWQSN